MRQSSTVHMYMYVVGRPDHPSLVSLYRQNWLAEKSLDSLKCPALKA
jgi:hypothetical protein